MTRPRLILLAAVVVLVAVVGWGVAHRRGSAPSGYPQAQLNPNAPIPTVDDGATTVYAHNLLLRKGPDFKVSIRWIRGLLERTSPHEVPSFDDPDSFVLEIQKGVIYARLDDLAHYLNAGAPTMPLTHVAITPTGADAVRIHGTVHKLVPLPVQLDGHFSVLPDSRIRLHVDKFDVLKVPLKGFFGLFHLQLADLVKSGGLAGVQLTGNDIVFNTEQLLPPPHIHGHMTAVRIAGENLEVVYGDSPVDDAKLAQWHNFLRLEGGTLAFGKLTMRHVDLTMIDASNDPWFDLDLVHYQAQLVNGYTRMTEKAGLEIFMPDLDEMKRTKQPVTAVSLEWLKNRNTSMPADVPK